MNGVMSANTQVQLDSMSGLLTDIISGKFL